MSMTITLFKYYGIDLDGYSTWLGTNEESAVILAGLMCLKIIICEESIRRNGKIVGTLHTHIILDPRVGTWCKNDNKTVNHVTYKNMMENLAKV